MVAPRSWPEHRPYALEALERLPKARRYSFVVASGGRVSGYFHAHSDLDLYALQVDGAPEPEDLDVEVDGLLVQINELAPALVEDMAVAIGQHRLTRTDRRQTEAFRTYGKLVSRLVTGVSLQSNAMGERAIQKFDSREFARLGVTVHGLMVARMLEDAAGAVEFGDAEIGIAAASRAVHAGLEAVLFAFGDVHWGDSLLFRRLTSYPQLAPIDRLARRQLSALFDPSLSPEQVLRAVRRGSRFASVLASLSALPSEPLGRWHDVDQLVDRAGGTDVAFSVAVRFADELCVLSPRSESMLSKGLVERELGLA